MRSLVSLFLCLFAVGFVYSDDKPDNEDGPIHKALTHKERTASDLETDKRRKPLEVLEFAGLKPGMKVLDIGGGGGYYAEIMARVVGAGGKVTLHNGRVFQAYVFDEITARTAKNRLPNLKVVVYDKGEFNPAKESADFVMMGLIYHDLHVKTPEGDDKDFHIDKIFPKIVAALKPGGKMLVVDHVAPEGSGTKHTSNLHRIDPLFAKKDIEKRGMKFVGELDVLRNKTDKHGLNVFKPEIRGKTDRFVYLFEKK